VNILPIPALDGGHVMFLIYEVVARRKPSDKFLEYDNPPIVPKPPKLEAPSFVNTYFMSFTYPFKVLIPLIYEVVARRKPSDKFLEYAQMAGMFILFALLIYANGT